MAYERLNVTDFVDRWNAEKVMHLEDGIIANEEAIALKAPAGFGYGDVMTWLGFDVSTWKSTGTFQEDLEATFSAMPQGTCKQVQFIDADGLNGQKFEGTLWKYTSAYGYLTACNYSGVQAVKTFYNNVWESWEWVNPPLETGVEYRTIERFNGKPVYVKHIDLGTLPASSEKAIYYITSSVDENGGTVIRWEAFATSSSGNSNTFPFYTSGGVLRAKIYFTEWSVGIYAFSDSSGNTGRATVWYIHNSD